MPEACLPPFSVWRSLRMLGLASVVALGFIAGLAQAAAETNPAQGGAEEVPPPKVVRLPDIGAVFDAAIDTPPGTSLEFPDSPAVEEMVIPEEVVVVEPAAPPPDPWSGRVEIGFNGTEGNSQVANTRVGARVQRKTDITEFTAKVSYALTNTRGLRTENQMISESRFEHFYFSPFSYYIHGTYEYDEFTAFDYRITGDVGLAWNVLDKNGTNLKLRGGAGTSREFGIPDAEYIPEASFGLSFSHQLTKRQRLAIDSDFFPDVRDWNDFRLRSNASWEIKVDPEGNLSLKFSLIDRYDSTPHGKKHNDLTYAAQLVWDF